MESWQDFFGDDYLRFCGAILTPERTKSEVEGLLRELKELPAGSSILDLGCGQGRIALPLAQRGYTVTGYDASEALLRHAREQAEKEHVPVRFMLGDMRELECEEPYDAIINIGTAFGYVPDNTDDARIMRRIARALKPGGFFIQDTENRDFKTARLQPRTWEKMGDVTIWSERSFRPVTGRWRETMRWQTPSGMQSAILDVRLYAASELVRLTEEAGLEVQHVYGGLNGESFTVNSPRIVMISRKREAAEHDETAFDSP
jgi:SAM-dependent methyltransferase